jgi:hypothetical protein
MEFGSRAQFFALDTVGEVAFSNAFGYLANDKDMYDVVKINGLTFPYVTVAATYLPILKMMLRWPLKYLLPRAGDESGFGAIMR